MNISWKTIGIFILILTVGSVVGVLAFGSVSDSSPVDPTDPTETGEYPSISADLEYESPPESLSTIYQTHSSAVDSVPHSYLYQQTVNGEMKAEFDTYYNYEEKEFYKESEFTGSNGDLRVERYVDSNRVYTQRSTADDSTATVESTQIDSEKANMLITSTLSSSNYTGLTITHKETIQQDSGEYFVYTVEASEESGDWESHSGQIVVSRTGVLVLYDVTSTLKSGETYTHRYELTSTDPEFEPPLWVEGV